MKCKTCGQTCLMLESKHKPEVSEFYCPTCHRSEWAHPDAPKFGHTGSPEA